MKILLNRFFAAIQFLTRIPVPVRNHSRFHDLADSALFFPVVGLFIAGGGLLLRFFLLRYVGKAAVVVLMLVYLVLITGALHEDALADAADGFGGGWNKEQILAIMRDSRIGSYGAIAVSLSLLARFVFLSELPPEKFAGYFVAGQVLSRWTALPLSSFLPSSRDGSGQGSLIAQKISWASLLIGTVLAVVIATALLKYKVLWVGLAALLIASLSAFYYRRRIGGITGDCLGATIQLTEIGVYLTGVVIR